ncbi:hypothetical protein [uncultured Shewanella sp.]|uniref:hypothetical protein n=1 Tax=uncultured Shewanella sp. TaxID=173975 RepID=UPI00262A2081|nr:hypothetical protein [uncultured Shewanella sp.]
MKGNFCTVKGFKPSPRTLETIKEMNRISDLATVLGVIMTYIPLFQIFAGRKTYPFASNGSTKKLQVLNSDWKTFADSLEAIPKIRRDRLRNLAGNMELYSTGEERKFWGCVTDALL